MQGTPLSSASEELQRAMPPPHSAVPSTAAPKRRLSAREGELQEQQQGKAGRQEQPDKKRKRAVGSVGGGAASRQAGKTGSGTATSVKNGRVRGRLQAMFTTLPVEILSEILSHLPPVMLLRLARTTKVFRALLMSKSARTIWRTAFEGDGVPALKAADMNGPALASLIWDKECELCGRSKVHKICYALRQRVCDVCLRANLRTATQIAAERSSVVHPESFKVCPWTDTPPCRGPQWPIPTADEPSTHFFLLPTVLAQSAHLTALAQQDRLDELLGVTGGQGAVSLYVAYWVERMKECAEDARKLQEWQGKFDEERVTGKKNLKAERKELIRKYCIEASHDPRDVNAALAPFSDVSALVEQPYPLTDRVWRKISQPIFASVERFKVERSAQEVQKQVEQVQKGKEEEALARVKVGIVARMRRRLQSDGQGQGRREQQALFLLGQIEERGNESAESDIMLLKTLGRFLGISDEPATSSSSTTTAVAAMGVAAGVAGGGVGAGGWLANFAGPMGFNRAPVMHQPHPQPQPHASQLRQIPPQPLPQQWSQRPLGAGLRMLPVPSPAVAGPASLVGSGIPLRVPPPPTPSLTPTLEMLLSAVEAVEERGRH